MAVCPKCRYEFNGEVPHPHDCEGIIESKREIGRRLFGAILSYQMGLKSVDGCIKRYASGEIHPSWGDIGWKLLRTLSENVNRAMTFGPTLGLKDGDPKN